MGCVCGAGTGAERGPFWMLTPWGGGHMHGFMGHPLGEESDEGHERPEGTVAKPNPNPQPNPQPDPD